MLNMEIILCRPKKALLTKSMQIKDIYGFHSWIFFIFSPIISKTLGLEIT